MIVIPALTAVNVDELFLSHTSLMQAQNCLHEVLATEIRQSF